jgi:UDP-N-acetylglucosamine diphosphorylase/glucosamine-1-phosphate N-acetyltransferase
LNGPSLYLVDDSVARDFDPLSTTRPVGELLHGCLTFRERWERAVGLACSGHITGPQLEGFDEPGSAPALAGHQISLAGPRWFASSRFVLASSRLPAEALEATSAHEQVLVNAGRVVAIRVPAPLPHSDVAARIGRAPTNESAVEVEGRWVEAVWELMSENAAQTDLDIRTYFTGETASLPSSVEVLGSGTISLGERILFEPGVVLDTRSGSIRVDDEVTIRAFTRLAGPSYIGPGSVVFGGNLSAVSLGPVCKVRGEIEDTVMSGYSNKAHDGFLGHAYLGRWVNLGALTTNSDLKNNYGSVRLRLPTGDVDTGLSKVGCFLGDHVKTGIGTMLNTGSLVGAGSNVFGGRMPPAYVPPYSWGEGSELSAYRFDKFIEVAERVMGRRDVALTPGLRAVLERAWNAQHGDGTSGGVAE